MLKTQVSLVCSDLDSSRSHEKKRKQVKMDEAQIKRAKVAESKDVYGEVKLVTSTQALSQMLAAKRSDSQRVSFLLEQCNARTKGKSFTYDEINSDFLRHKKNASLKLSISGGVAQNLQYLIKLVNAVIDYDISKERYSPEALVANASRTAVARRLPAFD